MNRLTLLVVAFVVALGGPVSANTFYRFAAPAVSEPIGGLIAKDGRVILGKGFSVQHPNAGHYVIEFDPGVFPSGCAAITVEGSEDPVVTDVFEYPTPDCRHTEWHVGIRDPQTLALKDATFHFIAVEQKQR